MQGRPKRHNVNDIVNDIVDVHVAAEAHQEAPAAVAH
jgi:hypothetical protein